MKYIIDTSIWSEAFRKNGRSDIVKNLDQLTEEGLAVMIGPVRQELLSGISNLNRFTKLRNLLMHLDHISLKREDYEKAAYFSNVCRKNGIQGSPTDFLICAVASERKYQILTLDRDFIFYKKYINIDVHEFV